MTTDEEEAPCPERVVDQKKIPPRSEEIVLDGTDAKGLVKIGALLRWDSCQT